MNWTRQHDIDAWLLSAGDCIVAREKVYGFCNYWFKEGNQSVLVWYLFLPGG